MSAHSWSGDKFLRVLILTIIMCLTLIGNLYVILQLFTRRQRTRFHLFILHLAIGDLTICFCTMTSELFLLIYDQEWILGNVACKLTLYIQVVTIASTVFISMAMTYDRYEAVCSPFRIRKSASQVRCIILACWSGSMIVALPQLFIFEESISPGMASKFRCASTGYTAQWQRCVYFTAFASYLLFIPAVCMIIWYIRIIRTIIRSTKHWTPILSTRRETIVPSRQQIRTVKLAMTIITVFLICWTPYMIITLIEVYSSGRFRLPSQFEGVLQIICLHQSGLNPLIYMIFDQKRRHSSALIFVSTSTNTGKYQRNKRDQQENVDAIVVLQTGNEKTEKVYQETVFARESEKNSFI